MYDWLVDWLVVLGLMPFETIFQSISGRLPKRAGVVGWCEGAG